MTSSITAAEVAHDLTGRHTDSTTGPAWRPGFRAQQASPRTVRLWHDGDAEQDHLDRYAETLRAKGHTVILERGHLRRRPTLRITHP